ncbi:hypothetical protein ACX0E7_14155, partial [Enterococcus faecium]
LAIQQALAHPAVEWGMLFLKTPPERGYFDFPPPEVKSVFFFFYENQKEKKTLLQTPQKNFSNSLLIKRHKKQRI